MWEESEQSLEPAGPPVRWTESPWLWVMAFSAAGFVVLWAMAPKYTARQGRLELQYYARQEMTRRQAEGTTEAREPGFEGAAPPPPAGELIIPLWPLWGLCGGAFVVSGTMLWRSTRAQRAGQGASHERGGS